MTTKARIASMRSAIVDLDIRDTREVLQQYSCDASGQPSVLPDLVAFPASTWEVQRVVRACAAHQIPITPAGARTGKSGGCIPLHGGVALSFERMNAILEIDPSDSVAVVQPGVVLADLQARVETFGRFYPPDPNSRGQCTIGGNIGENAGGPRALKYGVTRDYVLGMEWVLPSGEAIRVGRRTMKGVAGYDLTALFVGSEGTLGIATEATLKLIPLPNTVKTALLAFGTVGAAVAAAGRILDAGPLPRCLELFDDVAIATVAGRIGIPQGTGAALILEVDGVTDEVTLALMQHHNQCVDPEGFLGTFVAANEAQQAAIWEVRAAVSNALRQAHPFKLSEDVVVPRGKILGSIEAFKRVRTDPDMVVSTYGHVGDGNLHVNLLSNRPLSPSAFASAAAQVIEIALKNGGSITGEHGVGSAKLGFLPLEQSNAVRALQRSIRVLIDPLGIFNPGKIHLPLEKHQINQ